MRKITALLLLVLSSVAAIAQISFTHGTKFYFTGLAVKNTHEGLVATGAITTQGSVEKRQTQSGLLVIKDVPISSVPLNGDSIRCELEFAGVVRVSGEAVRSFKYCGEIPKNVVGY